MLDTERRLHESIDKVPVSPAIYALSDLDNVPVYVGYASESARIQVRRHLLEQVANVEFRLVVDPWEIAFVSTWPTTDLSAEQTNELERYLAYQYGSTGELTGRPIPDPVPTCSFDVPQRRCFQLLPEKVIQNRRKIDRRLAKQARHFAKLVHWCSEKRYLELLETCDVHFRRLNRLYDSFRRSIDT